MKRTTTPWHKIKAEYLQGVTPKDLAQKYKVSGKTIREKASKEGWVAEKTMICNNVQQDVQSRIKGLTNLALDTLVEVINDNETEKNVKVSACKAILDISGLKSLKQDITGIEGVSVVINREAVQVESNN
nr:MAG TPA: helix-turn-helix domain protein [Caudoviricetes sp.]